jgi:membrane associated rhomboid family serine protease
MIPLKDLNPTRSLAVLTIALIAVNAAVFLLQMSRSSVDEELDYYRFGMIPKCFMTQGDEARHEEALRDALIPLAKRWLEQEAVSRHDIYILSRYNLDDLVEQMRERVGRRREWMTPLTSMFMHGGWLHIIGNMWFLWIFGNNIEDACGRGRFVAFYLLCGLCAAAAHIVTAPSSVLPTIGASGAISGVLGAYILLYPHARIVSLIPIGFFYLAREVPAWVFLGVWILLQFLGGLPSLHNPAAGGVAWFAHIGGFAAGLALIYLFRRPRAAPPMGIEFELNGEGRAGNSL